MDEFIDSVNPRRMMNADIDIDAIHEEVLSKISTVEKPLSISAREPSPWEYQIPINQEDAYQLIPRFVEEEKMRQQNSADHIMAQTKKGALEGASAVDFIAATQEFSKKISTEEFSGSDFEMFQQYSLGVIKEKSEFFANQSLAEFPEGVPAQILQERFGISQSNEMISDPEQLRDIIQKSFTAKALIEHFSELKVLKKIHEKFSTENSTEKNNEENWDNSEISRDSFESQGENQSKLIREVMKSIDQASRELVDLLHVESALNLIFDVRNGYTSSSGGFYEGDSSDETTSKEKETLEIFSLIFESDENTEFIQEWVESMPGHESQSSEKRIQLGIRTYLDLNDPSNKDYRKNFVETLQTLFSKYKSTADRNVKNENIIFTEKVVDLILKNVSNANTQKAS